jgi:nucleotidyltransferase substrate binding protein (TIGR01987 family)
METLSRRVGAFRKALVSLEEILRHEPSVIVRDATIQRFEYTTEAAWKALKHFLSEHEGVDCSTPKSCIRAAFQAALLTEEQTETFLCMIDDRNLASHTYVEAVAQRIAASIPKYARLLRDLLGGMLERTAPVEGR